MEWDAGEAADEQRLKHIFGEGNALTEGAAILQRGNLRKVLRRSLHCQRDPVAHRADVEVKYLLNLFQLLMTIQDLDQIVLRLQ